MEEGIDSKKGGNQGNSIAGHFISLMPTLPHNTVNSNNCLGVIQEVSLTVEGRPVELPGTPLN